MSIYSTLIGEDLKTKMEDECKLYSGEFDIAAGSMAVPRGPFRERGERMLGKLVQNVSFRQRVGERERGRQTNMLSPPLFSLSFPTVVMGPAQKNATATKAPLNADRQSPLERERPSGRRPHMGNGGRNGLGLRPQRRTSCSERGCVTRDWTWVAQLTHGHMDVPDSVLFSVDETGAGGILALRDAEPAVVRLGVEEASELAREVGDVRLVENADQKGLAGVVRLEGGEARQLLI